MIDLLACSVWKRNAVSDDVLRSSRPGKCQWHCSGNQYEVFSAVPWSGHPAQERASAEVSVGKGF